MAWKVATTKAWILGCLGLVTFIVAFVVGFYVLSSSKTNGNGSAPSPSAPNEIAPSLEFWINVASSVSNSSEETFKDTKSPQYAALNWLSYDDPLRSNWTDETADYILRERYVVVLFYFATDGPRWSHQRKFLSPTSVCEWNDGWNIGQPHLLLGVACQNNSVNQIYLST